MDIEATPIAGVFVISSSKHTDKRGDFSRLFCHDDLNKVIGKRNILQINHSRTAKVGAIRGLHYQISPYSEIKFIRCLKGRVFDVAVDLRHGSKTFLSWFSHELTPSNNKMLVIPEGCAHGYQVLEKDSELLYLHTQFYHPESEAGVRYNDPKVGISWPVDCTEISRKDSEYACLDNDFQGITV